MIASSGLIAASAMLGGPGALSYGFNAPSPNNARRRVLRFAHLTDIHVQPERRGREGFIACLQHVQSLSEPPELIITGGDSIMDSFEADDARTQLQWDLWHDILRNECSIPVKSCIGNHDLWGWNKQKARTTGEEPNYGKQRAMDNLKLDERYYSAALPGAGWTLIVLDSTQPREGGGYAAYLDEAQRDWFERELRDTPRDRHVLIVSHIPIMTASGLLWARKNDRGDFTLSGSLVHQDAVALKDLFARHPNVRLCLSGHLHHVDRVDYNGVSYLGGGAVCGAWWKGHHQDCEEGYAVINLYDDGTFEREYITYGWDA